MKSIKDFILEANANNINSFKKLLKKYKVALQGPDGGGIAYITPTMNDLYPSICIEVYDDHWCCYLDVEEDGTIWVSLDEEGEGDETLDITQFDKPKKYGEDGMCYSYSENNAKALAQGLLKFK